MNAGVEIHAERADHPEVVALLGALDRYLGELYEPGANHILTVDELLAPEIDFFVARQGEHIVGTGAVRRGYTRRGAFGGYPDNGLSLFMSKALA